MINNISFTGRETMLTKNADKVAKTLEERVGYFNPAAPIIDKAEKFVSTVSKPKEIVNPGVESYVTSHAPMGFAKAEPSSTAKIDYYI